MMKKQIFKKILLFSNLLILTLISNLNAGNSVFHTVIDAPALAVGNALTGARFSHDAGLTNPARINQFKPGTFLCSSESGIMTGSIIDFDQTIAGWHSYSAYDSKKMDNSLLGE